jgi:MFS transporter, ENTS family, enterobactin (siderophore) exporter
LPKDLQLLFWSFFLWSFGYGLYNYVWPVYLEGLNADPSQVGLVFSIGFVALAACMIPGGILANKYDLKALLIIGWILSLPPMIMYYYARTWTDAIPGIILLQLSGFNVPAFNAYIAGASERQRTGSSFGVVWASAPFGAVLSPAVGGALLDWISIREIFLLSLAFFIVSTFVLFWMRTQPPEARNQGPPRLEVPRTKPEFTLLVFLAGAAVAFSITAPFLPLFFHDILSLSPSAILGLGSIQALGQTAFAIFLGRRADLRSRGQTMALGLILAAVGLAGIIATRNVLFAIPLIFFVGSARASSYIAYSILANTRSGQSRAGQYGFFLTLEALGFVVGSYLGGVLYSISSVSGFVTAIGLWLVLAAVAGVTSFRIKETPDIDLRDGADPGAS